MSLDLAYGEKPPVIDVIEGSTWKLTQVDRDGCPYAVQWARVILDEHTFGGRIRWRDCIGRLYEAPLNWVLGHNRELQLRTYDHLYVCTRYATYLLERDYRRWWGEA